MILDRNKIQKPDSLESRLFQGRWSDSPFSWSGYTPTLDYYKWVQVDPAIDAAFARVPSAGQGITDAATSGEAARGAFLSALAQGLNAVEAARSVFGTVSITTGILKSQEPNIEQLFTGSLASAVLDFTPTTGRNGKVMSTVNSVLDIVSGILSNPILSTALNSLSAIPIVGWVVSALKFVAQLVGKIMEIMAGRRADKVQRVRAGRQLLPMVQWDKHADDIVMQGFLSRIRDFDATWICLPRYHAARASDFVAKDAGGDDKIIQAWLLYGQGVNPDSVSENIDSGLGFVPGTTAIHGPMQLLTGGKSGFDIGGYFPTASQAAAVWWGNLLLDSPTLYSVRTDVVRISWERYLRAILEYAEFRLDYGWSISQFPQWSTDVSDDLGYPVAHLDPSNPSSNVYVPMADKCARWSRSDHLPAVESDEETIRIRQQHCRRSGGVKYPTSHAGVIFDRMNELFDWSRALRNKSGPRYDDVDFDRTTVGKEIRALKERQKEAIDGVMCCYVDTSRVMHKGRRVARFPALADDPDLRRAWRRNRRAFLESDAWKMVELESVPGGPDDPYAGDLDSEDREFYRALVSRGARVGVVSAPFSTTPFEFRSLKPPEEPLRVTVNRNVDKPVKALESDAPARTVHRKGVGAIPIIVAAAAGLVLIARNPKAARAARSAAAKAKSTILTNRKAAVAIGSVAAGAAIVTSKPRKSSSTPKRKSKMTEALSKKMSRDEAHALSSAASGRPSTSAEIWTKLADEGKL